jgi:hypothetical protein
LATEDMFGVVVLATKQIFFDGFHIEKIDDFLQDFVHGNSTEVNAWEHKLSGTDAGILPIRL